MGRVHARLRECGNVQPLPNPQPAKYEIFFVFPIFKFQVPSNSNIINAFLPPEHQPDTFNAVLVIFCSLFSSLFFIPIPFFHYFLYHLSLTMTKKQRSILDVLSRKRKPIPIGTLAEFTGYDKSQYRRTLKSIESKRLIEIKQDGKRNLVSITNTGRAWLRNNPCLTEDATPKRKGAIDYSDAHKLWAALGLKTITLSGEPYTIRPPGKAPINIKGLFDNYQTYASATKQIFARRHHSNVWFTPSETKKVGREKIFIYSKTLWIDFDKTKVEDGSPLPEHIRKEMLNALLQDISSDGLSVSAIVDTGAGFHIYFFIQNKIKNAIRLKHALQGLAVKYNADYNTAHPTANLRVPNSYNFKVSGRYFCKMLEFNPQLLNSLRSIESLVYHIQLPHTSSITPEHPQLTPSDKSSRPKRQSIRPTISESELLHRIKHDYTPRDTDRDHSPSGRIYFLICECIRHNYPKQKIISFFLDPSNKTSIYNPPFNKHNEVWLHRTYDKAYIEIHGSPPEPHK